MQILRSYEIQEITHTGVWWAWREWSVSHPALLLHAYTSHLIGHDVTQLMTSIRLISLLVRFVVWFSSWNHPTVSRNIYLPVNCGLTGLVSISRESHEKLLFPHFIMEKIHQEYEDCHIFQIDRWYQHNSMRSRELRNLRPGGNWEIWGEGVFA